MLHSGRLVYLINTVWRVRTSLQLLRITATQYFVGHAHLVFDPCEWSPLPLCLLLASVVSTVYFYRFGAFFFNIIESYYSLAQVMILLGNCPTDPIQSLQLSYANYLLLYNQSEPLRVNSIIISMSKFQKSKYDANNFDKDFTCEEAVLTPTDPEVILGINQEEFVGFSFTNPDFGMWTVSG